jgi:amino acid adenylation domain-containing protein/non-ribosomal peptide synthase protein (TIGR01720 family)
MHPKNIEGFQLSLEQRSLWTRAPENSLSCTALLIEGPLDSNRLQNALRQVESRHEILRTTFHRQRGIRFPLQIIGDTSAPFTEIDLSAENNFEQVFEQEQNRPFDFELDPPLRFTLVRLSSAKHVLLIAASALCVDRQTIANLIIELGQYYEGKSVSEEPLQYVDYCQWQSEMSEDENAESGRSFWRNQKPAKLQLPWEIQADNTAAQQSIFLTLASDTIQKIEAVSKRFSTSPASVLQTCWQTLLWRLTGEQSIAISNVFAGRNHEDLREAFGLFATSAPLNSHFEEDDKFSALLLETERVRRSAETFLNHIPEETVASTPIGFEYAELPAPHRNGNLQFSIYKQKHYLVKCKVMLSCVCSAENISAEFHYDPSLYRPENIEQLAACFETLLTSALENPDALASRLSILSDRDRQFLIFESNDTAAAYPDDKCVQQLFEEHAAETPQRLAVVCEERQLTYAELNAKANRLAHLLRRRGVGPDVPVGLCLERSAEVIVALLGVLKAGGAYVPLDPDSPPAHLAKLVGETRFTVLLTQERFLDRFHNFTGEIVCFDRDEGLLNRQPAANPGALATPEHLAYVIYTSGSTGTPKGAAITHRSLLNYDHFVRHSLLTQTSPLHFAVVSTLTADLGHTCLFPALTSGSTLHIISYEAATDPVLLDAYMKNHPIDVMKITPSHLKALLNAGDDYSLLPRRTLLIGGEALSYDLVKLIHTRKSTCQVINHYGPTETTVGVLTCKLDEDDAGTGTVPIGRPIANARAYVLNKEMEPVPAGVPGELYLAGAGLARGYLNNPIQTAHRFTPDPFSLEPGERCYKTGDMARHLGDGRIEFLGRLDHQVKIRGFRVELGEIEAALKQHATVREAVVLVDEDPPDRKRLIGCVVATKKGPQVSTELRSFLSERLPSYMVPSAIVLLESMPLTANGKVDRAQLAAQARVPTAATEDLIQPRNPAELLMSQIWAEILRLEHVGVRDNFFELGGDSILGIQIIAKANQMGFQLAPKQLFQNQTVAELVKVSGTALSMEDQQGPVAGEVPLTPMQQRFFEQKLSDQHLFSQAVVYEVEPALDPALMKAAVRQLLTHHDALRLRFVPEENGWKQLHANEEDDPVSYYQDLSPLASAEQQTVFENSSNELQSSIDLTHGPLVRIALFHFGESQPDRLLIIGHYLIIDGFSWRILLEDLENSYQQLSKGDTIRLPAKTTSFKLWSERMLRAADSEEIKQNLSYWLTEMPLEIGRLPRDHAAGLNVESSVGTVSKSLSVEETTALLREVPIAYQSEITDVLMTALLWSISRWSGDHALLVDLEGHGRSDTLLGEDLSRTVGRLTYRAPALLVNGTEDPGETLKSVKEQLRRFRDVSVSYGLLRYLSVNDELRTLPPSEVYFNYVGQLDQVLSASTISLKTAPQSLTAVRRTNNQRPYLLDISAMILDGKLQCIWEYSKNVYEQTTIASLAESFMNDLRTLIIHCQSPEAGGYTPSDFPSMDFDQHELDELIAKINMPAIYSEQELN